jgi:hypothetical protein
VDRRQREERFGAPAAVVEAAIAGAPVPDRLVRRWAELLGIAPDAAVLPLQLTGRLLAIPETLPLSLARDWLILLARLSPEHRRRSIEAIQALLAPMGPSRPAPDEEVATPGVGRHE